MKYWHGRQEDGNLDNDNNLKERFIKIAVSCGCKGIEDYNKDAGPKPFVAGGLDLPPERGDPLMKQADKQ